MAKYRVPAELMPGIYRDGVGFFVPGTIINLPDSASTEGEKPHRKLIPVDLEAEKAMKSAYKDEDVDLKPTETKPPSEEKVDDTMTVKETAKRFASRGKRAADS